MKVLISTACLLLGIGLATGVWYFAQSAEPTPEPEPLPEVLIVDPLVHNSKPNCASCGDARHPTPLLSKNDYEALIKQYALEPLNQSDALDTLCYYGMQTRTMMELHGVGKLDSERTEFLKQETSRTHAIMSVRVVDEEGVVRVSMTQREIALDSRQHHLVDQVHDVIPPEISGTLKRVGLHHVWARF